MLLKQVMFKMKPHHDTVCILIAPPRVSAQTSTVSSSGFRKLGSCSDSLASSNLNRDRISCIPKREGANFSVTVRVLTMTAARRQRMTRAGSQAVRQHKRLWVL